MPKKKSINKTKNIFKKGKWWPVHTEPCRYTGNVTTANIFKIFFYFEKFANDFEKLKQKIYK